MKVFHASHIHNIKSFDISHCRMGDYGPGFYFAENEEDTMVYGRYTYSAKIEANNYMDVENLTEDEIAKLQTIFKISSDYIDPDENKGTQIFGLIQAAWQIGMYPVKSVIKMLKALGYDSIKVQSKNFWVVFDSSQIQMIERNDQ